jgi:hypothetical protein
MGIAALRVAQATNDMHSAPGKFRDHGFVGMLADAAGMLRWMLDRWEVGAGARIPHEARFTVRGCGAHFEPGNRRVGAVMRRDVRCDLAPHSAEPSLHEGNAK